MRSLFPELITQNIEEQSMMRGNYSLWRIFRIDQFLRQVIRDSDSVAFVQRGNWVININIFDPLVVLIVI
ncbi:hypothetical protein D3C77_593260 [compost metagenome]